MTRATCAAYEQELVVRRIGARRRARAAARRVGGGGEHRDAHTELLCARRCLAAEFMAARWYPDIVIMANPTLIMQDLVQLLLATL